MKALRATAFCGIFILASLSCICSADEQDAQECTTVDDERVCDNASSASVADALLGVFGILVEPSQKKTGSEIVQSVKTKEEDAMEEERDRAVATPEAFDELRKENAAEADNKLFLGKLSELLLWSDTSTQGIFEPFFALINSEWQKANAGIELIQLFSNHTDRVKQQFEKYFGDIGLDKFNPVQLYYYMLHQEEKKNAVWKRRRHRYMPAVPVEEVMQLGDGIYICQLAYSNSCEDVVKYAKNFRNDMWEVRSCSVKALPFQPASYLLTPRTLDDEPEDYVEAILVVRATKELGDILSDSLLEAANFRDGKCHQGMMESGKFLHDKHREDLLKLLKESKRPKVKLTIVGHSLGGGAAQTTAVEFMDDDLIDAYAVGFGAPALFTAELSESVKDIVTSVIVDADMISRLSGASAVNAWLNVLGYNFTEPALADIDQAFSLLQEKFAPYGKWSLGLLDSARKKLENQVIKDAETLLMAREAVTRPPHVQELFPAGECMHIYRDGATWQGVYMSCTSFNELEVVKNMVDDHLASSGYYRGLIGYAREITNDLHWTFEHDMLGLPVQL